jgi:hypothetical protein
MTAAAHTPPTTDPTWAPRRALADAADRGLAPEKYRAAATRLLDHPGDLLAVLTDAGILQHHTRAAVTSWAGSTVSPDGTYKVTGAHHTEHQYATRWTRTDPAADTRS